MPASSLSRSHENLKNQAALLTPAQNASQRIDVAASPGRDVFHQRRSRGLAYESRRLFLILSEGFRRR
jgi:hypothetical protein